MLPDPVDDPLPTPRLPAPLLTPEMIEALRHTIEDRQYPPDQMALVTLPIDSMRRVLATIHAYRYAFTVLADWIETSQDWPQTYRLTAIDAVLQQARQMLAHPGTIIPPL